MIIGEVQYDTAYSNIMTCYKTTVYTGVELKQMFHHAMFLLNTINEINNTTVITKNHKNEDYDLLIDITDIKCSHNAILIYADSRVIKHVREYLSEIVTDLKYDIRFTGNGHGTALVCHL